jgi:vancomycin permeability regulator SanA
LLLGFVAVVVAGPWALVSVATDAHRYDVPDVPPQQVALVFGAGLSGPDTPSPFLAHRLDLAVRLWQLHKVRQVLVSGDNSTIYHNESGVMRHYLVRHGVPDNVITEDHAGFDTYDSCYRAKAIFGVRSAVLVTQDYHLARALWTCRHVGVHAVGVGTSEWDTDTGLMVRLQARELLSDGKALWQTLISKPAARFLGPPEKLSH